ncbi:hypothetical protein JAAARDRAFT_539229 [Jaapia argillacea MUCL 33604]|uniref:Uncharacterized protein n=1 Tax=Jaapia argillacea MUCL 33604 TaxID=933084 RepID=A0A067P8Q9_9AGAM|nr:hypothetical protein JAAARDRAFT_539229 [Jaapia argillacea MUCL 33604]
MFQCAGTYNSFGGCDVECLFRLVASVEVVRMGREDREVFRWGMGLVVVGLTFFIHPSLYIFVRLYIVNAIS